MLCLPPRGAAGEAVKVPLWPPPKAADPLSNVRLAAVPLGGDGDRSDSGEGRPGGSPLLVKVLLSNGDPTASPLPDEFKFSNRKICLNLKKCYRAWGCCWPGS